MSEKDFSERKFQDAFVNELTTKKWKAPDELNGNLRRVTVDTLINNWRNELNRLNTDQLEGIPLTDNEFNQVMMKVKGINNSYEAAVILAMEGGKGKIDGIYRDKNPKIKREQITLTIFSKEAVSGGASRYQIAREVETSYSLDNTKKKCRFDLVLLINGLPLINIELKRTDKSLDEAYEQFKRYYRNGEFINGFMAFSQMMVISTEIDTKYFATPKSLGDFNTAFVFNWSDSNNRIITHWREIIKEFLRIPMAHQMVGDYLVIDQSEEPQNRRHMLLRPYQVYALQAVEAAALSKSTEKGGHGGYVWHTTGSGKTITSFKTALFLSNRVGFDKVIFLVDRRELDKNTSENYKAYSYFEQIEVDDTKSTYSLKNKLTNGMRGIVVTTTFKLNSLVKEMEENQDYTIANKRLVFIIDEAHRTTMGGMMVNIKNYFKRNSLFYGFTGTPLFDENKHKGMANEKNELIDTTEKLFGKELHSYRIDEAIRDKNVLGFNVDYINTGEFYNYEDLRKRLIEKDCNGDKSKANWQLEKKYAQMSDLEIERLAKKEGLLIYYDKYHIPRVVEDMLKNWEFQSQGRYFNAILTVAFKDRVIAYYKEFKKQIKEKGININIAMTFSVGNENIDPEISISKNEDEKEKLYYSKVIEELFEDYEKFTGVKFSESNRDNGFQRYFEDLIKRTKKGGSGRGPKNIDLIIVADQLLTGYDSKLLNTLYVDRNLELQGLIQAYSRTNRVYKDNKEFGSIINFQYPKITEDNVKTALKLYGSGGTNSVAIVDDFEVAVNKFKSKLENLKETLKDITDWKNLDKNEQKKFIEVFKEAANQLNLVRQYYKFDWDKTDIGITKHEWLNYEGIYNNIPKETEVDISEPIPLVRDSSIVKSEIIDAAHILELIGKRTEKQNEFMSIDTESLKEIYEEIQELSDKGEHKQAMLIKEFVEEELLKGKVTSYLDFHTSYLKWKNEKKYSAIKEYADEWGMDPTVLRDSVEAYDVLEPKTIPFNDEINKTNDFNKAKNKNNLSKIRYTIEIMRELPNFLYKINEDFK